MAAATLTMRIDSDLKREASAVAEYYGFDLSGVTRAFYKQMVRDHAIPVSYTHLAACPDHLALELDLLAVMLRSSMNRQAEVFFLERFDWLTEYRRRLVDLGSDADFYVGLIDVIMGIRAQQESFCESSSFEYTADSVA